MKYRFCYQCGNQTGSVVKDGRIRAFCPHCQTVLYENPIPSVAILAANEQNEVLLVRRNTEPGKGGWSLGGGFLEMGETPESAVIRELKEETGLTGISPKLFDVRIHLNGYWGDVLIIAYSIQLQNDDIYPGDDVLEGGFFDINSRPSLIFPIHEDLLMKWTNSRSC